MSESLKRDGQTGPKYAVATVVCRACLALDSHLNRQRKADEPLIKQGFNPSAYRSYSIHTEDEMRAIVAAQQHTEQHAEHDH